MLEQKIKWCVSVCVNSWRKIKLNGKNFSHKNSWEEKNDKEKNFFRKKQVKCKTQNIFTQ